MNVVSSLTVGLPVYNGENYLEKSIEALLSQSYSDFELVISDNASTDGTADICRRFEKEDSRIRYIRQPRNIGASPNHNFFIHAVRAGVDFPLMIWRWATGPGGSTVTCAGCARTTGWRAARHGIQRPRAGSSPPSSPGPATTAT